MRPVPSFKKIRVPHSSPLLAWVGSRHRGSSPFCLFARRIALNVSPLDSTISRSSASFLPLYASIVRLLRANCALQLATSGIDIPPSRTPDKGRNPAPDQPRLEPLNINRIRHLELNPRPRIPHDQVHFCRQICPPQQRDHLIDRKST